MNPKDRIILPLDVSNLSDALRLAETLHMHVGAFKVGLELVNAAGMIVFDRLKEMGVERIFYDAKLHDIPNTVAGAMRSIAKRNLWMTNLHASGGSRMIKAAADALRESASQNALPPPLLLGVTLLTSIGEEELRNELHVSLPPADYVKSLAKMVRNSGGDGVVASPREIESVREACGGDFLIVTPGVRPVGSDMGDQRRTLTPSEAIRLGADYLVIGRPITASPNPVQAAERILEEIAAVS
jgi:orotidine-5'-phosphate decarboxylase